MTYDRENDLGRLIYQTAREMQTFGEKLFKPHGITPEQFHLLEYLRLDRGLSQREIGGMIRKTPANVTRILDRLVSRKLVRRQPNPVDRRAAMVFLSPEGDRLVREMFRLFDPLARRLVDGVGPADLVRTREVLSRIRENIDAMTAELQQRKKR